MMQPYFNPNYFQQPNYFQPQYDRLNQLQQSLQPTINGKIVDSIEVVRATDIPMDGNTYYFPKADGTELYAKRWLANGNTDITTYKPYLGDNSSLNAKNEPNGALNELKMALQEHIDSKFDELEKKLAQKKVKVNE